MNKQNTETHTGTCRFCRQSVIVRALPGCSQEKIDEEATLYCQCEAAQNYKKKQGTPGNGEKSN